MLLRRFRSTESLPVIMAALGGYFSAVMLWVIIEDSCPLLEIPSLEPFSLGMAILVGIFSGLLSSLYVYLVGAGPGGKKRMFHLFSTFNSCNNFVRNFTILSSTHWSLGCRLLTWPLQVNLLFIC